MKKKIVALMLAIPLFFIIIFGCFGIFFFHIFSSENVDFNSDDIHFKDYELLLMQCMDTLNVDYCHQIGSPNGAQVSYGIDWRLERKIECYQHIAEFTRNESVCQFIESIGIPTDENLTETTEKCTSKVALRKQDPSLCHNITSEYERGVCLEEIGRKIKKPTMCLEHPLEVDRTRCLFTVAEETGNSSICELIEDNDGKCYCLGVFGADQDYCEIPSYQEYRNRCYHHRAVILNVPSLCEKIVGDEEKPGFLGSGRSQYTTDNCYKESAIENSNPSVCERISEPDDRILCEAITTDDLELCRSISQKDKCYSGISKRAQDPNICMNCQYENNLFNCIMESQSQNSKLWDCSNLNDQDLMHYCQAVNQQSIEECNKMSKKSLQNFCHETLAIKMQDESFCKNIKEIIRKELCYKKIVFNETFSNMYPSRKFI
ncbi:MAG: hypothetical protein ABH950_00525 [Candidatus Altiarchaeota archaeon]